MGFVEINGMKFGSNARCRNAYVSTISGGMVGRGPAIPNKPDLAAIFLSNS